jgi:uncharacterized protein HemY
MMKVLGYLLQEEDMTEDDAAVAVSLALQNGENLRAYVWAESAFKKHSMSPILAGLLMNSMRLVGKTQDAEDFVKTLDPALKESPIVLLEMGILAYDALHFDEATQYFTQVREKDESADFAEEAKEYMNLIQIQKSATGSSDASHSWWF